MAEVINTNVFDSNKKFVDFAGLDYFWEKAKSYVDGVDSALTGRIAANEGAIKDIQDELETISGGVGSVGTQIDNKIAELDLPNNYDSKGSAYQALVDAKAYADGLNTTMDTRVKAVESFDHSVYAKSADVYAKDVVDTKVADAQAAAIAQAKLDAADALKSYYTKTEVDNLLSTNSTGDRAYAKQYTDELFGSFKFAANSDIDALFV